jgi:D-alanyl-D-alanine dipeptidase
MTKQNKDAPFSKLVYIDEYGLLGSNFYWNKHKANGISKQEIKRLGVSNDRVLVHADIVFPLILADRKFQRKGYRLYIKEGFRSRKLYQLVYDRRVKKFGKEDTDKVLNMADMPHATGKSVDIALINKYSGKEVPMRNWKDGTDALFIHFYKNKKQGRVYEELQEYIITAMLKLGFRLGKKREYFHFNYNPTAIPNY